SGWPGQRLQQAAEPGRGCRAGARRGARRHYPNAAVGGWPTAQKRGDWGTSQCSTSAGPGKLSPRKTRSSAPRPGIRYQVASTTPAMLRKARPLRHSPAKLLPSSAQRLYSERITSRSAARRFLLGKKYCAAAGRPPPAPHRRGRQGHCSVVASASATSSAKASARSPAIRSNVSRSWKGKPRWKKCGSSSRNVVAQTVTSSVLSKTMAVRWTCSTKKSSLLTRASLSSFTGQKEDKFTANW
nr:hypothetical protein [Tanacetum cinerariifolium]